MSNIVKVVVGLIAFAFYCILALSVCDVDGEIVGKRKASLSAKLRDLGYTDLRVEGDSCGEFKIVGSARAESLDQLKESCRVCGSQADLSGVRSSALATPSPAPLPNTKKVRAMDSLTIRGSVDKRSQGVLTLTGEVPSNSMRTRIVDAARKIYDGQVVDSMKVVQAQGTGESILESMSTEAIRSMIVLHPPATFTTTTRVTTLKGSFDNTRDYDLVQKRFSASQPSQYEVNIPDVDHSTLNLATCQSEVNRLLAG